MDRRRRQRGVLLVAAIVLLVVVSALVAAIAFVTATSGSSATDNLRSGQALYAAESGLEFEQRCLAQNVDWYRSTTDPVTTGPCPTAPITQNIGQGAYTAQTTLPATKLRRNVDNAANVVCVYTIARFPTAGPFLALQLDDDLTSGGEYVTYTGTTASSPACNNLPAFTGVARGQTIGGVVSGASTHTRGDRAYPVTTLAVANLPNSNSAPTSFQIVAHSKFLDMGTLDIEGEEILYTGATVSGGNLVLTGVRRCQNLTICAAHNVGVPVTPILVDSAFPDVEAEISSTGAVSGATRVERKLVQR